MIKIIIFWLLVIFFSINNDILDINTIDLKKVIIGDNY